MKCYESWVSQIAYNDNEATVDLIFAPAVVPLYQTGRTIY
jgi:plasmid replication initiation protein